MSKDDYPMRPDRVDRYEQRLAAFNEGRSAGYEIALQATGDYLEEKGYGMLAEEVTSHLHKSRPAPAKRPPVPREYYVGLVTILAIVVVGVLIGKLL